MRQPCPPVQKIAARAKDKLRHTCGLAGKTRPLTCRRRARGARLAGRNRRRPILFCWLNVPVQSVIGTSRAAEVWRIAVRAGPSALYPRLRQRASEGASFAFWVRATLVSNPIQLSRYTRLIFVT